MELCIVAFVFAFILSLEEEQNNERVRVFFFFDFCRCPNRLFITVYAFVTSSIIKTQNHLFLGKMNGSENDC